MKTAVLDSILVAMLSENTGAHMLDSGGAYGRNFSRNAGKTVADWRKMPQVSVRADVYTPNQGPHKDTVCGNFDISINVFHFLREVLGSYDSKLTRKLQRFATRKEYSNMGWLACVDEWLTSLNADKHAELGDGWINTYNGEDSLSQTLQYRGFELDGESYVALQIHGGCDVRGGYTRPRIFALPRYPNVSLWDNNRFTLTDDGEGQWDYGMGSTNFEQYTERNYPQKPALCDLNEAAFTLDPAERGKGKIFVDEKRVAYSPLNGKELIGYII